jgi:hypothetical protein
VLDNVMDPMHGTFLHKQSHSMAEGDNTASFGIRETDIGFVFEKEGQRDVNFDWTEWGDTDLHWMRLAIPYPKTGGPGGSFVIIGSYTPIVDNIAAVFHWRCRKLSGWQRDTWRFLYRNRLEARHWNVLEQDRVVLELMEPDANQREMLYQHDMGIVRLRRHLRSWPGPAGAGGTAGRGQGAGEGGMSHAPGRQPGHRAPCEDRQGPRTGLGHLVQLPGGGRRGRDVRHDRTSGLAPADAGPLPADAGGAGQDPRSGGGRWRQRRQHHQAGDLRHRHRAQGRGGRARRDFGTPYPCSTLVAVSALVFPELTVEIDAFARLGVDLQAVAG